MSIAPDSSVLIAGADPDHPFFGVADEALARVRSEGGRLVAHTVAETFAVLTGGLRHPAGVATTYLGQFAEAGVVGLSAERIPEAVSSLAGAGVVGAAVYDGLIGLSARDAGLTLLSLDVRARATYERCEVGFELLNADSR